MTHEKSRGLGSLEAPIRMNEESVSMLLPMNVELLWRDHPRGAGVLLDDDNHHHNHHHGLDTTCHDRSSTFREGLSVTSEDWLPPPRENHDSGTGTDPQVLCCNSPLHGQSHYCNHRGCFCGTTTNNPADLRTKLRARHANIMRQALHLSKEDCLVDTTTICTLPPQRTPLLLVSKGRGKGETKHDGDHHKHENHFVPVDKDNMEHSFHLSALGSALPVYDLGDEGGQSELSFLFGPMGRAFGERGERTNTKNGRKRELSLSPDNEKFGHCQPRSPTNHGGTGEVSVGKEASLASCSSTTSMSLSSLSSPQSSPDQTLSRDMVQDAKRYYDQEPQEVVERHDDDDEEEEEVQDTCLSSKSSKMAISPKKRQRRTTSLSPISLSTGTTGLRRASMNFNDLPSM